MKAVIQRVSESCVEVNGKTVGKIDGGFTVLLGVMKGDTEKEADLLAKKVAHLRIFEDEEGKMNLSVLDVGGSILLISQFTLCADLKKGNRPSFTDSAEPVEAKRLYEYFSMKLRENGVSNVQHGIFAAEMSVNIVNDGPVTIVMDTDTWPNSKV
ncbi:MAG: D-aminoacyl-tRNA deacylase [Acutalibacteraceae bacterium]